MKIYDLLDVAQNQIKNALWDNGTGFPANPSTNQYFYRTDTASKGLYTYNGSTWIRVSSDYKVPIAASDPTGAEGDLYFNNTSDTLFVYENGAWKPCIVLDRATDTGVIGVTTLATKADVTTGTNQTRAVTPLALRDSFDEPAGASFVGFNNTIGLPASPTDVQAAINALDTKISGGASFRGILYDGDDLRTYLPIIAGDQWKAGEDGDITTNGAVIPVFEGNDVIADVAMTVNADVVPANFAVIAASVPNTSETVAGIIRTATTNEAINGSLDLIAVTPLKLNQGITNDESSLPNPYKSTTSNPGVARIATQQEVNLGTDSEKYITPETLAAATTVSVADATESVRGVVEIATQTETNTGTLDAPYAVTPKKLNDRVATESLTGLIELATQNEVDGGTDTSRAVTAATLKANQDTNIDNSVYTVTGVTGSGSITHNLNSQNVSVEVFDEVSTPKERIWCGWTPTSGIIVDLQLSPPSGVTCRVVVKRLD